MDASDSGEEVRLEESDVDVWWDMWSDEVGGDSALVGVGVCLSQLWGGDWVLSAHHHKKAVSSALLDITQSFQKELIILVISYMI